jgi:hypothetical protein
MTTGRSFCIYILEDTTSYFTHAIRYNLSSM